MVYKTLQEFNVTGMDDVLVYVNEIISLNWLLFSIFMSLSIITYFFGRNSYSGKANIFGSFAVAGTLTTMLATIMRLTAGIVTIFQVIIWAVITMIAMVLFYYATREYN